MINITQFYGVPTWAKNFVSSLTILALLITSAGALLAPQYAEAATTFGSFNTDDNGSGGGANIVVTKPTSTASGDVLVANVVVREGSSTSITAPSGWTLILRTNNGTNVGMASYYHVAGPSEPTSYTFTIGNGQIQSVGGILRYSGVDTANPVEVSAGSTGNDTSNPIEVSAPSVTTTGAGARVINFFAIDDHIGGFGVGSASGSTERYDVNNPDASGDNQGPAVAADDFIKASAGSTGSSVATVSGGTGQWVSQTLALKQAIVDSTPPTVTVNQAGAQVDPTGTSPINFTVVFSESVSNFATGDVTLSGTAGATTATVTGSGTTYNVAVSGMTTNGTVIASVNAGVATDAAGNANTAGTSSDNQVTFTGLTPPTISATKIVCDTEADLPNMSGGADITASTASTFLGTHPNCHLQAGWVFEWASGSPANPGDNVGAAGGSWNAFSVTNGSGVATVQVPAGSSIGIREQMQSGYVPFTGVSGGNVSAEIYCAADVANYDNYDVVSSPAVNSTYHCVAFNALTAPTLTVTKTVTNDNGGTLGVGDFPLFIDATPTTSGTPVTVSIGAHTVSETNSAGYAATFGGDCAANGTVTLAAGQNKTCTITNNDIAPTLTVTKTVTNDNGGTKIISNFILKIASSIVTSGTPNTLNAGTYTVSEEAAAGYTGLIGTDCAANGSILLAIGENKNCTIVNDDNESSLTLNKVVIDNNDDNGTTPASAFTLTATGATGFSGVGPSVNSTGVVSFDAGNYDLSESGPTGYAASDWVCTGGTQVDADTVTVGLGQNVICTITNDDIALPVCSNGADDDSDGFADAADPGCHTDLDRNNPESYNANGTSEGNETTFATCSDGLDNDGDSTIDLLDGDCNGYTPKVVVHKSVINDNLGGTMTATQFTFDIANGTSYSDVAFDAQGQDGIKTLELQPGAYTVTEDAVQGYTSTMTGDCSGTISIGQTKHCYFTNDDQATTILVKKFLTNDNGKTNATTTFSFKLNGDGSSYFFNEIGEVLLSVLPGAFSVLEDASTNAGYTVDHGQSCSGSLALGETVTCVISNNDKPACSDGIENDIPSDGLIDAADPACNVFNGEGTVYDPFIQSEGNETTFAMCTDESDNDGDSQIDLADPDCASFKPTLIVRKVLSYEGEIPATFFNQFSFSLNGGAAQSFDSEDGVNTLTLDEEGSYTITETNIPGNWDFGSVSCLYDGESAGNSIENGHQIFVDAGDEVTCTFVNVWNPDFACSDGLDNDGDGAADSSDPGCHLDNDPNNENSYSPTLATEVNNPSTTPTNGGNFGGPNPSNFGGGSNGPFVLGAFTGPTSGDGANGGNTGDVLGKSCPFIDSFARIGLPNNPEQVKKLQEFLNRWVNAGLTVNGVFDSATEAAVRAFQVTYFDDILKPWNLTSATGVVYLTTLRKMNMLECPTLEIPLPMLIPWAL